MKENNPRGAACFLYVSLLLTSHFPSLHVSFRCYLKTISDLFCYFLDFLFAWGLDCIVSCMVWKGSKLTFSKRGEYKTYDKHGEIWTCTPPRCPAAARPAAVWGASPHLKIVAIFANIFHIFSRGQLMKFPYQFQLTMFVRYCLDFDLCAFRIKDAMDGHGCDCCRLLSGAGRQTQIMRGGYPKQPTPFPYTPIPHRPLYPRIGGITHPPIRQNSSELKREHF